MANRTPYTLSIDWRSTAPYQVLPGLEQWTCDLPNPTMLHVPVRLWCTAPGEWRGRMTIVGPPKSGQGYHRGTTAEVAEQDQSHQDKSRASWFTKASALHGSRSRSNSDSDVTVSMRFHIDHNSMHVCAGLGLVDERANEQPLACPRSHADLISPRKVQVNALVLGHHADDSEGVVVDGPNSVLSRTDLAQIANFNSLGVVHTHIAPKLHRRRVYRLIRRLGNFARSSTGLAMTAVTSDSGDGQRRRACLHPGRGPGTRFPEGLLPQKPARELPHSFFPTPTMSLKFKQGPSPAWPFVWPAFIVPSSHRHNFYVRGSGALRIFTGNLEDAQLPDNWRERLRCLVSSAVCLLTRSRW
ncbi:hypothetical protein BJV74DRAFT_794524 [Russula compacta]|nr:hypothetical protein BJV74DRAFT_794524 [Russula compacta]